MKLDAALASWMIDLRSRNISPPLKTFAIDNRIDLVITPGDHFFHGRGKRISDLVDEGLEASGP